MNHPHSSLTPHPSSPSSISPFLRTRNHPILPSPAPPLPPFLSPPSFPYSPRGRFSPSTSRTSTTEIISSTHPPSIHHHHPIPLPHHSILIHLHPFLPLESTAGHPFHRLSIYPFTSRCQVPRDSRRSFLSHAQTTSLTPLSQRDTHQSLYLGGSDHPYLDSTRSSIGGYTNTPLALSTSHSTPRHPRSLQHITLNPSKGPKGDRRSKEGPHPISQTDSQSRGVQRIERDERESALREEG